MGNLMNQNEPARFEGPFIDLRVVLYVRCCGTETQAAASSVKKYCFVSQVSHSVQKGLPHPPQALCSRAIQN